MTSVETNPPRWAEAMLGSLVRPSDRESISGDLLEEYREVRRPALGALRADVWYVKHVFSVLWRVMWPCALAMAALRLVVFVLSAFDEGAAVRLWWNPSLVPAPGVSLLDGVLYVAAGYYASGRTGLVRSGVMAAAATSIFGVAIVLGGAAVRDPDLLLAPFRQPFIFVILSALVSIAAASAIVLGSIGGAAGRGNPEILKS